MDSFTEPEIEEVVKAFAEEKGTKLGVIMNGAHPAHRRRRRARQISGSFETLGKGLDRSG